MTRLRRYAWLTLALAAVGIVSAGLLMGRALLIDSEREIRAKVKYGMCREEVDAILGPPDGELQNMRVLFYVRPTTLGNGKKETYFIFYDNDWRLDAVDVGPELDINTDVPLKWRK